MNGHVPATLLFIVIAVSLYPIQGLLAPEEERTYVIKMSEMENSESVLFLGDVMLGRYVATLIERHGYSYPFKKLESLLGSATYTLANLEGPIPEVYVKTPSNGYQFAFPKSATTTLSIGRISAVSLANNHTADYGDEGYAHTVSVLKSASIESFGHSRFTAKSFWKKRVGGVDTVVFGINMISPSWNEVASLNTTRNLCTEHKEAYVIAFIHWGEEYQKKHSSAQERYAKKLLETCVSAIIGAHPHVVEGVSVYNSKPVFYSLGNAVFDQYFSEETERGLGVNLSFEKDAAVFELIPLVSENSQPEVAENEEKVILLDALAKRSDETLQEQLRSGFLRIPYPAGIKKQ